MYKVYCLKDNDKIVYIGYTTRSLHNRWRHHKNTYPDRARLVIELIQETDNKDQAKALEILFIKQYNTLVPNGLNIALGHANNDGKKLTEYGKNTRFGFRARTKEEELKRKTKAATATSKACSKPVICMNTGIKYPSARACAKALGLQPSSLSLVLRGLRPHTKGLKFKFITEVPN